MSGRLNPADFPGLDELASSQAIVSPANRQQAHIEAGDTLSSDIPIHDLLTSNALWSRLGLAPERLLSRALASPPPSLSYRDANMDGSPGMLNRSRSCNGLPSQHAARTEEGSASVLEHNQGHNSVEEGLTLVIQLAAMILALQIIQLQKGRPAHPDGPPPYPNQPAATGVPNTAPSSSPTRADEAPAVGTDASNAAPVQQTPNPIKHTPLIYRDAAAREAYDRARREGAKEYDAEHGLNTIRGRIASWWAHVLG